MNYPIYAGRRPLVKGALLVLASLVASSASAQTEAEGLLLQGKLEDAAKSLTETLSNEPEDALARTQLGVVQFLRGVERLAQTNYRYGTGSKRQWAPFFRLPVPPNPDPEQVTYQDVRDGLQQFLDDLTTAEATLSKVGDAPVKWSLDLSKVRLDLNADGAAAPQESLGAVYMQFVGPRFRRPQEEPQAGPPAFVVGIDTADVYWLRGYCHAISALGEALLAHDQQRTFGLTAQLVFPNAQVDPEYLAYRPEDANNPHGWMHDGLDAIAMIHLVSWPVTEPERMKAAHAHLLEMVAMSRKSWDQVMKEEDNDHEWIPGPTQTSVLPDATMDRRRIDTWLRFLDEAEELLRGEKLAPMWRGPPGARGVNLKRVFYEPRHFDLVLWAQGAAAAPYLEEGPLTKPETWSTFNEVFRGNFLGFAFWIN